MRASPAAPSSPKPSRSTAPASRPITSPSKTPPAIPARPSPSPTAATAASSSTAVSSATRTRSSPTTAASTTSTPTSRAASTTSSATPPPSSTATSSTPTAPASSLRSRAPRRAAAHRLRHPQLPRHRQLRAASPHHKKMPSSRAKPHKRVCQLGCPIPSGSPGLGGNQATTTRIAAASSQGWVPTAAPAPVPPPHATAATDPSMPGARSIAPSPASARRMIGLGRPWRTWSRVIYINTELPAEMNPVGWNNWGSAANESTAYYAESNSTRPRRDHQVPRPPRACPGRTSSPPTQAKQYLPQNFLAGPKSGPKSKSAHWDPIAEATKLPWHLFPSVTSAGNSAPAPNPADQGIGRLSLLSHHQQLK